MLNHTQELYGSKLTALDGGIGRVKDFYFDENNWVIRYLVVDTGSWLTGRLVLLSPHAFGKFDRMEGTLHLKLSKQQIERSPSIESHQRISRQYELEYYRYYGWPAYWQGGGMWGLGGFPVVSPPVSEKVTAQLPHHRNDQPLQSTHAVTGYAIETTDGTVGRVTGLMVDDRSWAIRELVVDPGHWYAGKEILITPGKVERINHGESKVFVSLTKADLPQTTEHLVAHAHPGKREPVTFPTV